MTEICLNFAWKTTGDTEKAGCLHSCLTNGEEEGPGAKKAPTQFLFWPLGPPSLVCLSSKASQKKTAQRKVAGPFAITHLQFPITPQQFPITPQQFPITPWLHLHFLISSELITKNYTCTYTFQIFKIRGVMPPTSRVQTLG